MSLLLKLTKEDLERIERIKKSSKASSKVGVVRRALDLLEEELLKEEKIKRWRKAAEVCAASSKEVNAEIEEEDLPDGY